jgi:uncharacterized protein YggE
MRTPLALALALAAMAVAAAPAAAQTVDTTPLISADGTGTATLAPDQADFQVGVLRLAATSHAARDAANRRVAAVVKALGAGGIAPADIQTVGLSVRRERVAAKHHKTRIRYRAAQQLDVRSHDIAHLGALLDAVANAGADEVEAPDFGFADPSQGRLLATRAALADARRRADDAAAQAGLRITGVRSVDLDPGSASSDFDKDASGAGESTPAASVAPTVVHPGTQEFDETVRVVYTAVAV